MRFQISFIALMLLSAAIMAQKSTDLTVHEWGTFTAQYTNEGKAKNDLHNRVEEPVPEFVFNIALDHILCIHTPQFRLHKDDYYIYGINYKLGNIFIRMETPVLYFYSDSAIHNVSVKVGFKDGSINEMYPNPIVYENQQHFDVRKSFPSCDAFIGGFAGYTGKAEWEIDILPPNDNQSLTYPDEQVPAIWSAPRKTGSNLIKYGPQVEKYIFYRGLGSFSNTLIPNYTKSGNLFLTNKTGEDLSYILVYEVDSLGNRFLWNPINYGNSINYFFKKPDKIIEEREWNSIYKVHFTYALMEAGLFRDEAEAMLNTWNESYFEKPGIKIFWITPRSFVDAVLPLDISHPVRNLERVMVGRTEIDPFTKPSSYHIDEKEIFVDQIQYEIYPNPAQQFIRIKHDRSATYPISVEFTDITGRLVKVSESKLDAYIEMDIPIDDLPSGWYNLRIDNGQSVSHRKLLVQR